MDDLSHHLRGKTIRGTTTNELVRLLREAEYGDGLHPDFDDHFYDALERDLNAKDTVWESLHHVLLAKVQPLRRKRCELLREMDQITFKLADAGARDWRPRPVHSGNTSIQV